MYCICVYMHYISGKLCPKNLQPRLFWPAWSAIAKRLQFIFIFLFCDSNSKLSEACYIPVEWLFQFISNGALHTPDFLKVQLSTSRKQRRGQLTTADHAGQKNHNRFRLRLFLAYFCSLVWLQEWSPKQHTFKQRCTTCSNYNKHFGFNSQHNWEGVSEYMTI